MERQMPFWVMKPSQMPLGHFPRLKAKTARYHMSKCNIELIVIQFHDFWMRYLPILKSLRMCKPLRFPHNGPHYPTKITIKYIISHSISVWSAKCSSEWWNQVRCSSGTFPGWRPKGTALGIVHTKQIVSIFRDDTNNFTRWGSTRTSIHMYGKAIMSRKMKKVINLKDNEGQCVAANSVYCHLPKR